MLGKRGRSVPGADHSSLLVKFQVIEILCQRKKICGHLRTTPKVVLWFQYSCTHLHRQLPFTQIPSKNKEILWRMLYHTLCLTQVSCIPGRSQTMEPGSSNFHSSISTSGVLDYISLHTRFMWCWGSNPVLCACQASTVPTELRPQLFNWH